MPQEIETLLTDHGVAALTGRARKTLQKDRLHGGGVPYIKLGRLVRYRRGDVEAWLASRPAFHSTSEYGAEMRVGTIDPAFQVIGFRSAFCRG